ncbi:MAG: cytochrome P460 family protein [Nitrospirota bacterium]
MSNFIKVGCQISVRICTQALLAVGLGLSMLSGASAQDITISEQTFGCILDWPKVRNTYFKHSDPQKLKEAMRIFRDSVPDKEYPVGTILQLIPFEAMVKHPREKFSNTNGWEFFHLDVSKEGTKIADRGEQVVNRSQGVTCLSCHQPAARFDFVCEKGHGCAPIPFDDQKIAEIQKADLRCSKK